MVYLIVIIIKCNFVIFIKILEIGRRVSHPQLVSPLLRALVRVLLLDLVHRGVLVEALDVSSQGVDHPHGVEVGEGALAPAQPTSPQLDDALENNNGNYEIVLEEVNNSVCGFLWETALECYGQCWSDVLRE